MTRHYTADEMARLAPYAEHFRTAIAARWSRYPGREALQTIHDIHDAATGVETRLHADCGACVLKLLRAAGALYFASLEDTPTPEKKTARRVRK